MPQIKRRWKPRWWWWPDGLPKEICLSGSEQQTIRIHKKQPGVCRDASNVLCFGPGVFSFHSLMTAKKEFCLVEAPLRTGVFVRCPPPYSQKFIHMRSLLGTHNCACLFNGHTRRWELSVSNTTWNPAPHPSQLSHKGCPIYFFIHVNINMLYPSFWNGSN